MKRRILSIDFDYFIDTDIKTRNEKFLQAEDNISQAEREKEWLDLYKQYPEIESIGVIDLFNIVCEDLANLRFGQVLIADSHKDIWRVIKRVPEKDSLEVVHIDFHHDNYCMYSGEGVTCANWVRKLKEMRPECFINWCRREDSERESLEGRYPYPNSTNLVVEGEFDYIFLCLSPEWTPPHLIPKFREMCEEVSHLIHI